MRSRQLPDGRGTRARVSVGRLAPVGRPRPLDSMIQLSGTDHEGRVPAPSRSVEPRPGPPVAAASDAYRHFARYLRSTASGT